MLIVNSPVSLPPRACQTLNQAYVASSLAGDGLIVPFPENLFAAFRPQIGNYSKTKCASSIYRRDFRITGDDILFTALTTGNDVCDGGNVYGMIITRDAFDSVKVVAVIIDSEVECDLKRR